MTTPSPLLSEALETGLAAVRASLDDMERQTRLLIIELCRLQQQDIAGSDRSATDDLFAEAPAE